MNGKLAIMAILTVWVAGTGSAKTLSPASDSRCSVSNGSGVVSCVGRVLGILDGAAATRSYSEYIDNKTSSEGTSSRDALLTGEARKLAFTQTPEPGTMLLTGTTIGLAGFFLSRRRRKVSSTR